MIERVQEVGILKSNSIVLYKKFTGRKYNEVSKDNLLQNLSEKLKKNIDFEALKQQKEVKDINEYATKYIKMYESATGKAFKWANSVAQQKKIVEISQVFTNAILSRYSGRGRFSERTVGLVTFTLTGPQNHTDKKIIRDFQKIIDHLRRVKNWVIDENGKTTRVEALPIENYIWRAETQENGNIHFHLLIDSFFNMHTLKKIWNKWLEKNGYPPAVNSVRVDSLKDVRNRVAYITKYMSKPPLRNEYKKMPRRLLDEIPNDEKYRRPIIGKTWGCSEKLLKYSKYQRFYENDISWLVEVLYGLERVELGEELGKYVSVFKGNVAKAVNECSLNVRKFLKDGYRKIYWQIYEMGKGVEELATEILEPPKIPKIRWLQLSLFS